MEVVYHFSRLKIEERTIFTVNTLPVSYSAFHTKQCFCFTFTCCTAVSIIGNQEKVSFH